MDKDYIIDLIKEEIQAVGVYSKHITDCKDGKLKEILTKIRNDEKAHAQALIGWLHSYIDAIAV